MSMATLAMADWIPGLMIGVFLLLSIVLILVVLIQRPQGGGLGGAFGAGGSGETTFGAKTGDALTIATVTVFVLWLCLAVGLVFATRPDTLAAPQPEVAPTGSGAAVLDGAEPAETDPTVTDPASTEPAPAEPPVEAPAANPTTEPASEPATDPAADPGTEPAVDPASEPAAPPPGF